MLNFEVDVGFCVYVGMVNIFETEAVVEDIKAGAACGILMGGPVVSNVSCNLAGDNEETEAFDLKAGAAVEKH